jgi:hypothetical protein
MKKVAAALVVITQMCVALLPASGAAAQQNLRALAREQASRDPSVPIVIPSPPGELWPKTIEEIATESDLIVHAKLSRINSYLDPKEDRVHTDYRILEPNVIAGRPPSFSTSVPGPRVPLILTVWGGDVIVEGVTIRGIETNRTAITNDGYYLLFLKPSRRPEPVLYEVHYGAIFEIAQDAVTPLLKQANDVFRGTVDAGLKDFISRIQTAVKVR